MIDAPYLNNASLNFIKKAVDKVKLYEEEEFNEKVELRNIKEAGLFCKHLEEKGRYCFADVFNLLKSDNMLEDIQNSQIQQDSDLNQFIITDRNFNKRRIKKLLDYKQNDFKFGLISPQKRNKSSPSQPIISKIDQLIELAQNEGIDTQKIVENNLKKEYSQWIQKEREKLEIKSHRFSHYYNQELMVDKYFDKFENIDENELLDKLKHKETSRKVVGNKDELMLRNNNINDEVKKSIPDINLVENYYQHFIEQQIVSSKNDNKEYQLLSSSINYTEKLINFKVEGDFEENQNKEYHIEQKQDYKESEFKHKINKYIKKQIKHDKNQNRSVNVMKKSKINPIKRDLEKGELSDEDNEIKRMIEMRLLLREQNKNLVNRKYMKIQNIYKCSYDYVNAILSHIEKNQNSISSVQSSIEVKRQISNFKKMRSVINPSNYEAIDLIDKLTKVIDNTEDKTRLESILRSTSASISKKIKKVRIPSSIQKVVPTLQLNIAKISQNQTDIIESNEQKYLDFEKPYSFNKIYSCKEYKLAHLIDKMNIDRNNILISESKLKGKHNTNIDIHWNKDVLLKIFGINDKIPCTVTYFQVVSFNEIIMTIKGSTLLFFLNIFDFTVNKSIDFEFPISKVHMITGKQPHYLRKQHILAIITDNCLMSFYDYKNNVKIRTSSSFTQKKQKVLMIDDLFINSVTFIFILTMSHIIIFEFDKAQIIHEVSTFHIQEIINQNKLSPFDNNDDLFFRDYSESKMEIANNIYKFGTFGTQHFYLMGNKRVNIYKMVWVNNVKVQSKFKGDESMKINNEIEIKLISSFFTRLSSIDIILGNVSVLVFQVDQLIYEYQIELEQLSLIYSNTNKFMIKALMSCNSDGNSYYKFVQKFDNQGSDKDEKKIIEVFKRINSSISDSRLANLIEYSNFHFQPYKQNCMMIVLGENKGQDINISITEIN